MEIYGQTGQVMVPEGDKMTVQRWKDAEPTDTPPPPIASPNGDPVSYLAAVVRKEIVPSGLASLDVNITVVEILEAAHKSANTGKAVKL
jgi:hypothetical protein